MSGMELLLRAATIRNDAISADVRATSSGSVADNDETFHSSKTSRSNSKTSLAPKKRMKFHCRAVVSCPRSSASDAALATPAGSRARLITDDFTSLHSEVTTEDASNEMLTPNNRALKRCSKDRTASKNGRRGSSFKKKSNHSRGPKHLHSNDLSSEMTDVDGNDVCMGYFSMPRCKAPLVVVPKTDTTDTHVVLSRHPDPQEANEAEELHKHVPASTDQEIMRYLAAGLSPPGTTLPEEKHKSHQEMATKLLLCRAYLQMRYLALTDQ